MTTPWPSTCISRGPWNSCSGLPWQPQPLSPNIAHLGESYHQWPWDSALNCRTEGPLRPKETDLAIPVPMTTIMQMPLQAATPGDTPSFTHTNHPLLKPTVPQTPDVESISFISQPQATPRIGPARLTNKLLHLQERMNVATRATVDSHCKELELNTELTAYLNDAQAIEAIKEAEVHHAAAIKEAEVHCTTTTFALQQTHRESMLMLKCEVKAEEGWDCQAFMGTFGVVLQACLPKTHRH